MATERVGMTLQEAIAVCARKVARLQLEELPREWEVFAPELGEYDWLRITAAAIELIEDVPDPLYAEAFKVLAARSEKEELDERR